MWVYVLAPLYLVIAFVKVNQIFFDQSTHQIFTLKLNMGTFFSEHRYFISKIEVKLSRKRDKNSLYDYFREYCKLLRSCKHRTEGCSTNLTEKLN